MSIAMKPVGEAIYTNGAVMMTGIVLYYRERRWKKTNTTWFLVFFCVRFDCSKNNCHFHFSDKYLSIE
tara:strand:- start:124 stop:327 length:204 start_codon:yes stop_codon:yes gene_type:complete